jgi:epoxyqueuosine reductase
MGPDALKQELLAAAVELGFTAAGVTGVEPFAQARTRALAAIDAGRMEGMDWYTRERVDAATDLGSRYPWAKSIVALAWPYRPARRLGEAAVATPAGVPGRPRGRVSAYACLDQDGQVVDYHTLLAERCDALVAWLRGRHPDVRAKRFVDHGWAMDRAVAERAGVGFAGKHASVLTRGAGSYVMLAEVLLSIPLPTDLPATRSCGSCTACMPACPTGAIVAPGVIDARRCISYLTIEHRGSIPVELRPQMGTWAFGCDLCQEACPINERLAPDAGADPGATTAHGPVPFPDLVECLSLSEADFATRFRHTAVWRAGRAGLARNCAIALGNAGDPSVAPALRAARDLDPDPAVRESAAWALSRLAVA